MSLSYTHTTCSDYGFMRSDGFTGPCVRDPDIPYTDPCADGTKTTYLKSRGYRKVAGDVCVNGVEDEFGYYTFTCCDASGNPRPANNGTSKMV